MSFTLAHSRSIIAAVLRSGATHEMQPLAVAVLDAGGHLVAFERQDGASMKRFEIAHGKAYGGLSLGVGSRALMERAESQPYFIASATAAIGGSLVPVPGGVLVQCPMSRQTVGAVGVSGDTSDHDEQAAVEGIRSVGFKAVPD